jgi:hypothetical protein
LVNVAHGDMACFDFGSRRLVKGKSNGKEVQVGDYALHVQCPWRITLEDKIIVGRGDMFGDILLKQNNTPACDVDWNKGNTFDGIVKEFLLNESRQLMVQIVSVGHAGSLTILLEGNYRLEIFPYDSSEDEHWRFFKPHAGEPHLVFTGEGIREG